MSPAHRTRFQAIRKSVEEHRKAGIPFEQVANAIVHALSAPNSRSHSIVGNSARPIAIVSALPDRPRDWLVLR